MRTATTLLALALVAACEREGLAPSGFDEDGDVPDLPAARCGDGVANDALLCLDSFTVKLPYAHEFIRYADFDGDGRRDLFAINTSYQLFAAIFFEGGMEGDGPRLLGHHTFERYDSFRAVVLDFDGDGLMDLASATQFWFWSGELEYNNIELVAWRNLGHYEFDEDVKVQANGNENLAASLAVGDIDGDGRTDLVGVWSQGDALVGAYVDETNDMDYVFGLDLKPLQLVGQPLVAAADYNGDAHADFVLIDGTGRAWRIIGGPEHQLTVLDPQAQDAVLTPESQTLYARDIDSDGITDLAAVRADYGAQGDPAFTISLALGRPDGGFTALTQFDAAYPLTYAGFVFSSPEQDVTHLGFFDLDDSGQLALVYAHRGRPELVIHPRIAETLGTAPLIVPLDFPANSLFVDDFEGDGEDAIYVTISDITKVKPSVEHPDGQISEHFLVRFLPDP